MAFIAGFSKVAAEPSAARTVGKILSSPFKVVGVGAARGGKFLGRQAKEFGKGVAEGVPPPRRSPLTGASKPERGSQYASKYVSKHRKELQFTPKTEKASIQSKALQKMKERAGRINDIRKGQKPSFVSRHPIVSAVGAYAAYKAITSPKEDEAPQARVIYPQNY